MYYNARWYDPSLGHFAQADALVPGGVQGYDRYAYVNNDPVRYTDPTGHSVDGCVGSGCKFVVADAITRQYKNVKIESVVKWNLADLDEIYAGLSKIMGKDGFNGSLKAFTKAFGAVTFVPVANGSIRGDPHYVAEADQRTGTISVTPNAITDSIIHEMGHLFSWAEKRKNEHVTSYGAMYSNIFDAGPGASKYARDTNSPGEDFADSFLAVIRDGPGTRSVDQPRIEVILSLIQSYTESIHTFSPGR